MVIQTQQKHRWNSCDPKGSAIPTQLVVPVAWLVPKFVDEPHSFTENLVDKGLYRKNWLMIFYNLETPFWINNDFFFNFPILKKIIWICNLYLNLDPILFAFKHKRRNEETSLNIIGEEFVPIRCEDLKRVYNLYHQIVQRCCQGEIYGSCKYNYIHGEYFAFFVTEGLTWVASNKFILLLFRGSFNLIIYFLSFYVTS